MRLFLSVVMVALLAVPAHADLLKFKCTAPTQYVEACDLPGLKTASPLDSLWVVFTVEPVAPTVAAARRDSVWRRPGGLVELVYSLPRGNYRVGAIAARKRVGGGLTYGCEWRYVDLETVPMIPAPVKFE